MLVSIKIEFLFLNPLARRSKWHGRKIHTGISQVNRLIRLLSSNTLRDFPRVYRAFLAATYRLAGSGVPAAIYIRRECFRICEMEQQLGIYAR